MFSFDYEYWGIFKGALEKGEDVVQDLACQYKLSMNDLCNSQITPTYRGESLKEA